MWSNPEGNGWIDEYLTSKTQNKQANKQKQTNENPNNPCSSRMVVIDAIQMVLYWRNHSWTHFASIPLPHPDYPKHNELYTHSKWLTSKVLFGDLHKSIIYISYISIYLKYTSPGQEATYVWHNSTRRQDMFITPLNIMAADEVYTERAGSSTAKIQSGAVITRSIFSQISTKDICGSSIWLIFCLRSCNYWCNILQYWTAL